MEPASRLAWNPEPTTCSDGSQLDNGALPASMAVAFREDKLALHSTGLAADGRMTVLESKAPLRMTVEPDLHSDDSPSGASMRRTSLSEVTRSGDSLQSHTPG